MGRTVTLHLSNLGDRPRSVEVRERVPVSEVAPVDVRLEDLGGGRFDPADGSLVFHADLPPDGTREIAYTWRLSAPEKVVLPF